MNNISITGLASELVTETRRSVLDLRYTQDGRWAVFLPVGNIMSIVPGSIRNTPEESILYCLDWWKNRSPDSPFMYGYPTREEWKLTGIKHRES